MRVLPEAAGMRLREPRLAFGFRPAGAVAAVFFTSAHTIAASHEAFIRDAPLIILDEPTASMGPRVRARPVTRVRSLYAGRTVR
jgi:ABC-type sugar transport system ATPase subunit